MKTVSADDLSEADSIFQGVAQLLVEGDPVFVAGSDLKIDFGATATGQLDLQMLHQALSDAHTPFFRSHGQRIDPAVRRSYVYVLVDTRGPRLATSKWIPNRIGGVTVIVSQIRPGRRAIAAGAGFGSLLSLPRHAE
jgi:hypothetical protein